jgi:ATP-dependent Clp protease protease subunit
MAASMGAFLLGAGTKGMRYALSNSIILIHQPLGGASGQATDIEIHAKHIIETKNKVNSMIAGFTGQDLATVVAATDRDNFMTASEARDFGIVDEVIVTRPDVKTK